METSFTVLRGKDFFHDGVNLFVNRAEETFQLAYHSHDFLEISYVSEGQGYHYLNDGIRPVSKGDIMLLPIGVQHVFRPSSGAAGQKLVVYNCIFPQALLEQAEALVPEADIGRLFAENGCVVRDPHLFIEPLLLRMFNEYTKRDRGWQGVLFALFVQLLVDLSRAFARSTDTPANVETSDVMEQAIEYIRMNASTPLTLRFMARRYGISERHFFRLFRQRTGQSFLDYLQNVRIRMACTHLAETHQKIGAIAEAVGYRDLQSFHRVFKRIVGATPGQFRRMAWNNRRGPYGQEK